MTSIFFKSKKDLEDANRFYALGGLKTYLLSDLKFDGEIWIENQFKSEFNSVSNSLEKPKEAHVMS